MTSENSQLFHKCVWMWFRPLISSYSDNCNTCVSKLVKKTSLLIAYFINDKGKALSHEYCLSWQVCGKQTIWKMSLSVLQAEAAKMAANPSAEKGESSVSLGRSVAWRLLIAFVKLWFSRVSLAVLKLTSLLNYRPHDLIHQTAVDSLTGALHLYT